MPQFHIRLRDESTTPLPLRLRSVGHYHVGPTWFDAVKQKDFVQVFWGIRGTGVIRLRGQEHILAPHTVMVLFPGDTHDIRANGEAWEYRWWTMDGPLAEITTRAFGLTSGAPRKAGACPHALFDALPRFIYSPAPAAEAEASVVCYELLSLAARKEHMPQQEDTCLSQRCLALMRERYMDPAFSVGDMATELGLDRSHLSRTFKEQTGIPPREYLLRFRMQQGIERLQTGRSNIQEVAAQCGFSSASYFTRVVRSQTGLSPTELLQRVRSSEL